jgi:hypothetical protein
VDINGYTFVTYNQSFYDSNATKWQLVTPWRSNVPLWGTDASQFNPFIPKGGTVSVFVASFYRAGRVTSKSDGVTIGGIPTLRFILGNDLLQNKTNNPENDVYFQDKYNGFVNQTQVMSAPVFISKVHFLDSNGHCSFYQVIIR